MLEKRSIHEFTADENIYDCTGRRGSEWCAILDGWQGDKSRYAPIADYLADVYQVRRLWAQAIAVYYRRSRAAQV